MKIACIRSNGNDNDLCQKKYELLCSKYVYGKMDKVYKYVCSPYKYPIALMNYINNSVNEKDKLYFLCESDISRNFDISKHVMDTLRAMNISFQCYDGWNQEIFNYHAELWLNTIIIQILDIPYGKQIRKFRAKNGFELQFNYKESTCCCCYDYMNLKNFNHTCDCGVYSMDEYRAGLDFEYLTTGLVEIADYINTENEIIRVERIIKD